jgi:hypothetical protein
MKDFTDKFLQTGAEACRPGFAKALKVAGISHTNAEF